MKRYLFMASIVGITSIMAYAGTLSKDPNGNIVETYSEEEYQVGLDQRRKAVENAQYRVDKLTLELAQAEARLVLVQAELQDWEAAKQ